MASTFSVWSSKNDDQILSATSDLSVTLLVFQHLMLVSLFMSLCISFYCPVSHNPVHLHVFLFNTILQLDGGRNFSLGSNCIYIFLCLFSPMGSQITDEETIHNNWHCHVSQIFIYKHIDMKHHVKWCSYYTVCLLQPLWKILVTFHCMMNRAQQSRVCAVKLSYLRGPCSDKMGRWQQWKW